MHTHQLKRNSANMRAQQVQIHQHRHNESVIEHNLVMTKIQLLVATITLLTGASRWNFNSLQKEVHSFL
jgi:hypothetical protein